LFRNLDIRCSIILFREEQEKFNIWVALLNLENSYGSKESLDKIFQEALIANEPKKIYMKMVELYIKGDKKEVRLFIHNFTLKTISFTCPNYRFFVFRRIISACS